MSDYNKNIFFTLQQLCKNTHCRLSLFITVCGCYSLESLSLVFLCLLFIRIIINYLHRVHNPVWVTNRSGAACSVVRLRLVRLNRSLVSSAEVVTDFFSKRAEIRLLYLWENVKKPNWKIQTDHITEFVSLSYTSPLLWSACVFLGRKKKKQLHDIRSGSHYRKKSILTFLTLPRSVSDFWKQMKMKKPQGGHKSFLLCIFNAIPDKYHLCWPNVTIQYITVMTRILNNTSHCFFIWMRIEFSCFFFSMWVI